MVHIELCAVFFWNIVLRSICYQTTPRRLSRDEVTKYYQLKVAGYTPSRNPGDRTLNHNLKLC